MVRGLTAAVKHAPAVLAVERRGVTKAVVEPAPIIDLDPLVARAGLLGRRAGPHVPIRDGLSRAAERARALGVSAIQVFTDDPRGWAPRAEPHADVGVFREALGASEASPPSIVKVKRFAIEPMFEEDAVTRMEELGHDFFVFVNAETERTAVLYRRRDGDYGLIEPTVGGRYSSGLAGNDMPGNVSAAGSLGQSASGRRR
jgi:hypothetical protein